MLLSVTVACVTLMSGPGDLGPCDGAAIDDAAAIHGAAAIHDAGAGQRADAAALRARGYDLAYNLDFDEAVATLKRAGTVEPTNVANFRALAAVTWLRILFDRGSVTVDDYMGQAVKRNAPLKKPAANLDALFRESSSRALALAEQRVGAEPRNPSAHYELGAAIALAASYGATIDGAIFGAVRTARRAYRAHERTLELDPRRKEAALVVGSYRYAISTLTLPVRWMAYLAGFDAGREEGLKLIEEAAATATDVQTEARFALVILYNRERRFDEALRILRALQRQYPRNRLFWLEAGATALRAGRRAEADAVLTEGLARLAQDQRPRMFGEEALWHYKRGAARVGQDRRAEAAADLRVALSREARDWVRGRAHLEQGKLADLGGDRQTARTEYDAAVRLCEIDNDPVGAREARRLREAGYRGSEIG